MTKVEGLEQDIRACRFAPNGSPQPPPVTGRDRLPGFAPLRGS